MPKRRAGSVAQGLERTISAMGDRLGDVEEGLLALTRQLATQVDSDPGNAAMWREYRTALTVLMSIEEADADDTEGWIVSIKTRMPAPMGDTA